FELARGAAVTGEDRRTIAVLVFVDDADALIVAVHANDSEDRSKDFVRVHLAADLHVVDERNPDEEALLLELLFAAVHDDLRTFSLCALKVRNNSVARVLSDERTHF